MTHPPELSDVFPVLPTPFFEDESLDLDSLGTLIDRVLEAGARGLTVLGSGAEAVYLTESERDAVLAYAVKRIDGRATVLSGVMRYGTHQAVEQGKRFRDLGADAIMVALPQYYVTPLSSVIGHYARFVREVGVPTLYYHYPKPTHLELGPEQVGKLFAEVDLVGIKNSAVDTSNVLAQIEAIGRPIRMFTGQSFDLLPCLRGGAVGSICPVATLMPRTARSIVAEHDAGKGDAAQEAQNRIFQAAPFVMPEPTDEGLVAVPHAGVKEALATAGIIRSATIRAPQPSLSDERRRQIRQLVPTLLEL